MGDRICLTIKDGEETSPTLYAHWMGKGLLKEFEMFLKRYPNIRSEPSNLMVNFIIHLGIEMGGVRDGGLYIYPDLKHSSSPDDNGSYVYDVRKKEMIKETRGDYEPDECEESD